MEYKTFEDLEHEPHPNSLCAEKGGTQAIIKFDNDYKFSVVRIPYTEGGSKGLYEIAVTKDSKIIDVVLDLTEKQVTEIMIKVQNFK